MFFCVFCACNCQVQIIIYICKRIVDQFLFLCRQSKREKMRKIKKDNVLQFALKPYSNKIDIFINIIEIYSSDQSPKRIIDTLCHSRHASNIKPLKIKKLSKESKQN